MLRDLSDWHSQRNYSWQPIFCQGPQKNIPLNIWNARYFFQTEISQMKILQEITRCGTKCSGKQTNHLLLLIYPPPPLHSPCSQIHEYIHKEKSNVISLCFSWSKRKAGYHTGVYSVLAPFLTELFHPDPIYRKSTLSPTFDKQLSGSVMQTKIFWGFE